MANQKRPYRLIWEFGRGYHEPRTLTFATAEAAIKAWEELNPETSKPWAEVRGPEGRLRPAPR